MKLTENIDEHISAYEQEKGETIRPQVVALIKEMAAAGYKFEALGHKDACGGYAQRTKESFIEWGKRELIDPVGEDHPIVELMYMCYMDGYNAGRAQHEG